MRDQSINTYTKGDGAGGSFFSGVSGRSPSAGLDAKNVGIELKKSRGFRS